VVAALQARLAESGSPEPLLSSDGSEPPDPVEVVRAAAFQCALLDALALTLPAPTPRDRPDGTTPSTSSHRVSTGCTSN
jgi:hypothetical protein